jgi:Zn-dependent M28 family amino/carboxypeptidase
MKHAALAAVIALGQVSAVAPRTLVAEVGTLTAATDNGGRFDALTSLLRTHHLAFTVEPFAIEYSIGAEPRIQGRNVVVSIGRGAQPVVVGAHYDAVRLNDGSLSHGAVDNAASCVALIHAAEALQASPLDWRVTFVWFDMEELGLLGSSRYLDAHRGDRIRAMLNFDVNAYGDATVFAPPPGGDDATLQRTFLEVCAREAIDCTRFPSLPMGDDRSFGRAHVPTLSVATITPVELHQMWLLMNAGAGAGLIPGTEPAVLRTIHTANDVLDAVDGETVARIARLIASVVRQLSPAESSR